MTALIPIYAISCIPSLLPKEILARFGKNVDNILWIISLFPTLVIFAIWGNRLADTLSLSQLNHSVVTHLGPNPSFIEKLISTVLGQGGLEFALLLVNFYFLASFFANNSTSDQKLLLHRSRAMFSVIFLIGLPFFFSEQYYDAVDVQVSSVGFNQDLVVFSVISYLGILGLLFSCLIWSHATLSGEFSTKLFVSQLSISVLLLALLANSELVFSIYREVVLFSSLGLVVIPLMTVLLAMQICNENKEKTRIKQSYQIIAWILTYSFSFVISGFIYSKFFMQDIVGLAILFYSLGNVCVIISASFPFMALPYLGYDSQAFAEFTHLRYLSLFIPALMMYAAEFPQMLIISLLFANFIGIVLSWLFSNIWPEKLNSTY